MGNIPFAPSQLFDYQRRGGSIRDLMVMRGDQAAEAARRSGDIWANAIGGIGQQAAGMLAQREEQKRAEKQIRARDEATLKLLSNPDADDDTLLAGMVNIWGPKDGLKMAESARAYRSKQSADPKQELQNMAIGLDGFSRLTPEAQAAAYQGLKQRFGPAAQKLGLNVPEEWTPEAPASIKAIRDSMFTVMGIKDPEAAAPKMHKVTVAGPGGAPIEKLVTEDELRQGVTPYQEPKAPKAPNFDYRDMGDSVGVYQDGKLIRKDPKGVSPSAEGATEIEGFLSGLERGDISMSDVPAKDRNRVLAAAADRGLDTRTKAQKTIDADAEAVLSSLAQLEDQAEKTITATSGPGAMVQGEVQRILDKVGLAEQTRLWDAQTAKLAGLARQLGERGTLTDKDIERVQALIPGLTDPVTVRQKKLEDVRQIIEAGLRQKASSRVKFGRSKPSSGETLGKYRVVRKS